MLFQRNLVYKQDINIKIGICNMLDNVTLNSGVKTRKILSVDSLYEWQKKYWNKENQYYFGISSRDSWVGELNLEDDADKFWNNGTCELKKWIENNCKDIDCMIDKSYKILYSYMTSNTKLYAKFLTSYGIEEKVIAILPTPTELGWNINGSNYILRVYSKVNTDIIKREENRCSYKRKWTFLYKSEEFTQGKTPELALNDMSSKAKKALSLLYGAKVNKDNFVDALKSIPDIDRNSIYNFSFYHVDEIFNRILSSNRFINPLKQRSVPLDINRIINKKPNKDSDFSEQEYQNLVLSTDRKISDLENSRLSVYKSKFASAFNFYDAALVFDAFKTTTNKAAGRARLLLDNSIIKDGVIYTLCSVKDDKTGNVSEKYCNMYEMIKNNIRPITSLSSISSAPFGVNDDAKRIMMTAKLKAQAVPVLGETSSFTHETNARVVFGDFEGYNFGDAIIISKSFAEKLTRKFDKKFILKPLQQSKINNDRIGPGDYISVKYFESLMNTSRFNNLRNIKIESITSSGVMHISAIAPFSVGDKITNYHGSKGIVTTILEDEDMPRLKNDINDNFKAGPFDVIISSMSVYRRKSLGQIFEAWAKVYNITDVDNIKDAVLKYQDLLNEFSSKSVVEWHGAECIKPCGINAFIRLDHDSVTKQSFSTIRKNYSSNLKLGEMELLNLAARGFYNILSELDIRSLNKHKNSIKDIENMQKYGELRLKPSTANDFLSISKNLGVEISIDGKTLSNNSNSNDRIVNNDTIDL